MRKTKQFTIRIDDRPGLLSELAMALWGKGVNIQAFRAEVSGGTAVIHLVVDKPAAARRALVKHGWSATEETIAFLTLADKPGRSEMRKKDGGSE